MCAYGKVDWKVPNYIRKVPNYIGKAPNYIGKVPT
jgi:hypothetical protein